MYYTTTEYPEYRTKSTIPLLNHEALSQKHYTLLTGKTPYLVVFNTGDRIKKIRIKFPQMRFQYVLQTLICCNIFNKRHG